MPIESLMKAGLASEMATRRVDQIWREQDEQRLTVIITNEGRQALGLDVTDEEPSAAAPNADWTVPDAEEDQRLSVSLRPEQPSCGYAPNVGRRPAVPGVLKAGDRSGTRSMSASTHRRRSRGSDAGTGPDVHVGGGNTSCVLLLTIRHMSGS